MEEKAFLEYVKDFFKRGDGNDEANVQSGAETGATENPDVVALRKEVETLKAELAKASEANDAGQPDTPDNNNEQDELALLKAEINEAKQTIAALKDKNLELSLHGSVGNTLSPEKEMDKVFLESFTPLTTEQVAKLIK